MSNTPPPRAAREATLCTCCAGGEALADQSTEGRVVARTTANDKRDGVGISRGVANHAARNAAHLGGVCSDKAVNHLVGKIDGIVVKSRHESFLLRTGASLAGLIVLAQCSNYDCGNLDFQVESDRAHYLSTNQAYFTASRRWENSHSYKSGSS